MAGSFILLVRDKVAANMLREPGPEAVEPLYTGTPC